MVDQALTAEFGVQIAGSPIEFILCEYRLAVLITLL